MANEIQWVPGSYTTKGGATGAAEFMLENGHYASGLPEAMSKVKAQIGGRRGEKSLHNPLDEPTEASVRKIAEKLMDLQERGRK